MAEHEVSFLPSPTPEQRRAAAGQYDRANQVIATGNHDYGIRLLLSCCLLDPANLIYRQTLRRAQKKKHRNNMRGSWLAWLTTAWPKAKIKRAKGSRDWITVLELGERALTSNPWDVTVQMDMADAADRLGLTDMAIWLLEQARSKASKNLALNRHLARLYERRGNFREAIALWELIRKAAPDDVEAAGKAKDLAANETIARGHYEEAVGEASIGQKPDPTRHRKKKRSGEIEKYPEKEPEQPDLEEPTAPAKRPVGTEQTLLEKIKDNPTNVNNYLQLVAMYRRVGRMDEARELLQQALDPTGNSFEISAELADLEIEPFRQNLSITEERLRENAEDEELKKIRIRLLKEINTREMDIFRQKAERYPTDMIYHFEMGVRLLRAGQTDEAIRELQTARSDPGLHWKAALYLGHCFKNRNNWRLAKRNFEDALQQAPETEMEKRKDILYQLAQGCAGQGELAEAIDWGMELANLDFSFRNIGNLLDEWQGQMQSGES